MPQVSFRALRIFEEEDGFHRRIVTRKREELPEGDVLVRVHYSALNYKDALSATGNKGVSRNYPHTPGIDAAGKVVESRDPAFAEGDRVIVTSYDLGMNTDGGFAEYMTLHASGLFKLPEAMSFEDGALVEPLAVSYRAVKQAGAVYPDRLAVIGGGTIGLLALAVAKAIGVRETFIAVKYPQQAK
ncbi:MAG: oxidoreductase, partial [Bacteroidetes bacterium]